MPHCINCGDDFIPRHRNHKKYCSKECTTSYNNKRASEILWEKKGQIIHTCVSCGRDIDQTLYNSDKYCSKKCKKSTDDKMYRMRHLEKSKTYQKRWRETNTQILKKYMSEYRRINKDFIKEKRKLLSKEYFLFHHAKHRAAETNTEFNITVDDINIPKKCPILGIKLCLDNNKAQVNSPSIDRIDNSKGYVKGNVWVISKKANTLKNDGTLKEFIKLVCALRQKEKEGHNV